MKVFLKILFCIFTMLITTVGEVKSSTVVNVAITCTTQSTDYYPSGLPYPSMLNPQEQPYKFNGKEFDTMHGLNMYDYSARHYDAAIARWHVPDPLAEMRYSISPYAYTSNNPVSRTDPTGMLDDWYLNLNKGIVEYQEGNKGRFNEGLIHLAADNASIGDIENALSSKNFEYQKDASVEGGFRVDTEKQYKGWAMMQIFSPDNVSAIFGITAGTGGAAEKVASRSAARGVSRVVAKKGAEVAAKGSSNVLLNTSKQLQAKFKHADDFGVMGNYNKANAAKFSSAINQHINSAGVQIIQGTYRGQPVIHYVNPNTGLNVISTPSGQFWSGWKLSPAQLQNVLKHGGL